MVNNEFHVIGRALTNYVEFASGQYKTYYVEVEIEKMGSKIGNNFTIPIIFFLTNKAINVNQEIKGKQVVVNGYLDHAKTTDKLSVRVIGQNLYVINKNETFDFDENCIEDMLENGK